MNPYIIAEVGSNYKDFGDCLVSVKEAVAAGADAVKFQLFSEQDLYGYGSTRRQFLPDQIEGLSRAAKALGIDFMCTAFSPEGVAMVDPWVKTHKVASSEMLHKDLLKAIAETGKPVYISTGGHKLEDIGKVFSIVPRETVTLLYCCNAYPSTQHDLTWINELRALFNCSIGFSDHSLDWLTPYYAWVFYGACVIEKHVNFVGVSSADAPHSIDKQGFRALVKKIRVGDKQDFLTPEQSQAYRIHNRRWVVTKPVKLGEKIDETNSGTYRQFRWDHGQDLEKYFDPFAQVHGRKALVDLEVGQVITTRNTGL